MTHTHTPSIARCVLISSTNMRDGWYSVLIFLRSLLFYFRTKYVLILQFSHFPWIWINWFSDSSCTRYCKSYYITHSFAFKRWRTRMNKIWIEWKARTIIVCTCRFFHCEIFDRILLWKQNVYGIRLFSSFQLIGRA